MTILYIILMLVIVICEWELVKTALAPIIDIVVAMAFIFYLVIVIVVELALMVIAPIALCLGYESRDWHINVARKLMLGGGGKKNVDTG